MKRAPQSHNHMFQTLLCPRNLRNLQIVTQVRSLLFIKYSLCSATKVKNPPLQSSRDRINETHQNWSSTGFSGIAHSVLLRFSDASDIKKDDSYADASLKDLLLEISDTIPETTRKFLRIGPLNPENVLEILLVFQFEGENVGFRTEKVEILWEIFKRAKRQNMGFEHLARSKEVMASMLVQGKMLKEAELLLLEIERDGFLLNCGESLSNLIEGYVAIGDLDNAFKVFDKMRRRSLVPLLSCYRVLIDCLIQMKKAQLSYGVCLDMAEMGINFTDKEKASFENAIRLHCREGKIQESRNLCLKLRALGLKPSGFILDEIACGYCEKKDFDDLLSFFIEIRCAPHVLAGNKIVHTLCRIFGVERADFFRRELEHLGFKPNEITFGILISWSCRERNLRSAFVYLSEILSRGLNPDMHSYNAIISGLFNNGMWKHAKDIYDELVSMGSIPSLATYRLLLAGYCREKLFDEAKTIVFEMRRCGLIELSSQMDPLSKAFTFLGFDPMAVRVRRDNDIGFSNTDFFDNLGNGLYLDTDLDKYNARLTQILEDSLVPDFNSLVVMECDLQNQNLKAALLLTDEMIRWGQDMSIYVFSQLVKALCASRSNVLKVFGLLEKFPKLTNQLDEETLNLLIQACCKSQMVYNRRLFVDELVQRRLTIKSDTYIALFLSFCRNGISKDLHDLWEIARNNKWVPTLEDTKALLECFGRHKMTKPTLELLESMLVLYPHLSSQICDTFVEQLCVSRFPSVAHVLVEELQQKGFLVNKMAYNHLIKGLCKEKMFHVACKVFDALLAKKMAPCWDVFVSLSPQLLRANKFENAFKLMKEVSSEDKSLESHSFSIAVIKGYCLTGKMEEASKIFRDMLIKGLIRDGEVFNIMIQGYCKNDDVKKFRELLGSLIRKNLSLSISSFRNLICWMCRYNVALTLGLKKIMLGRSKHHNLIIYNILIFHLLSSGKNVVVNKILDELIEERLHFDEVTYNFLIFGFLKCNNVSSSVSYLSSMISKGFMPSKRNLRKVITCLCDVGETGKALKLSGEMEVKGWIHDSVVQNAIAESLLSCGKLLEAEHFLDLMVRKSLIPDNIIYDNLIKRFCQYGRLNKAVDLLNTMLSKGNIPDSTSYNSLVYSFASDNDLNRAMDFHIEMLARNLKPGVKTWDVLIHGFCQKGKTAEAERLLISMVRLGETPTREMFTCVINQYCFEKNMRKSSEITQIMQQCGYDPDFDTHWSLISNLRQSINNGDNNNSSSEGFLSRLLSGSRFLHRNISNRK